MVHRANRWRALAAAVVIGAAAPAVAQDVTVFAAVSLTNALESVAKQYRLRTGGKVRFSFAASSVLAKQIEVARKPTSSPPPTKSGWTTSTSASTSRARPARAGSPTPSC